MPDHLLNRLHQILPQGLRKYSDHKRDRDDLPVGTLFVARRPVSAAGIVRGDLIFMFPNSPPRKDLRAFACEARPVSRVAFADLADSIDELEAVDHSWWGAPDNEQLVRYLKKWADRTPAKSWVTRLYVLGRPWGTSSTPVVANSITAAIATLLADAGCRMPDGADANQSEESIRAESIREEARQLKDQVEHMCEAALAWRSSSECERAQAAVALRGSAAAVRSTVREWATFAGKLREACDIAEPIHNAHAAVLSICALNHVLVSPVRSAVLGTVDDFMAGDVLMQLADDVWDAVLAIAGEIT